MENEFVIEIAGEQINLAAKGKAQIVRLTRLTSFIDSYGIAALKDLQFDDAGNATDMITVIVKFVGSIDEEGLMLLGEMVSGKPKAFVEENFDLEWVMDGVDTLLKTPAFKKILDRFFGNRG